MRYIVSDIHGCYDQYQMLLEKIHFTENDMLYVLGDAVDRGPEPIKVLQDMMRRRNVIFISANNEPSGCLQTFMTIESLLSIVWRLPRGSNTPPLGAFQI